MNNGIFDLNIFESADANDTIPVDDILDASINESGDDFAKINVPGGLDEKPDAKPYDANSVSVPEKTEMTAAQYNSNLELLKKSFKEAAELIDAMQSVKVVDRDVFAEQLAFNEEVLLNALDNGPLYESSDRDDKAAIKKLCQDLRQPVLAELKKQGVKTLVRGALTAYKDYHNSITVDDKTGRGKLGTRKRIDPWQVICHAKLPADVDKVEKLTKHLNTMFKDKLDMMHIFYFVTGENVNSYTREELDKTKKAFDIQFYVDSDQSAIMKEENKKYLSGSIKAVKND